jgi:hypothetical protein
VPAPGTAGVSCTWKSSVAERTHKKFSGLDEIGPLAPKTAMLKLCPGRASRVSTTRLGALNPLTTRPPGAPSTAPSAPSTHTSA